MSLAYDRLNVYDYEANKDLHFESIEDIRKAILKEVKKVKK